MLARRSLGEAKQSRTKSGWDRVRSCWAEDTVFVSFGHSFRTRAELPINTIMLYNNRNKPCLKNLSPFDTLRVNRG